MTVVTLTVRGVLKYGIGTKNDDDDVAENGIEMPSVDEKDLPKMQ